MEGRGGQGGDSGNVEVWQVDLCVRVVVCVCVGGYECVGVWVVCVREGMLMCMCGCRHVCGMCVLYGVCVCVDGGMKGVGTGFITPFRFIHICNYSYWLALIHPTLFETHVPARCRQDHGAIWSQPWEKVRNFLSCEGRHTEWLEIFLARMDCVLSTTDS